jgi:PAS domain S-box-containing protein
MSSAAASLPFPMGLKTSVAPGAQRHTVAELFVTYEQKVFAQTNRLFWWLLLAQWAFAVIIAAIWSPRAWAGTQSSLHPHLIAAIALGGVLVSLPLALIQWLPYHPATRHAVAVAQVSFSALLIHLTGGRIETHFHVFGSLAFVALYRDWRVIATATVVVAVDHLLRGLWYPESVYGVPHATYWRTLEHAGWVVFEDVVLVWACFFSRREMREICERENALAAERARFKFIFESVPVGIAFALPGENTSLLVNPAHDRITGLSADEARQPGALERATHAEDLAREAPLTERFAHGEIDHFTVENRFLHAAGNVVCANLTRRMFTDPLTGAKQTITTLVDITERKAAEAKLAETHKQLVEASRQAGMAEVATGVLHNVGNVLNSVNVSATLVLDQIHESKATNLPKLAEMLQANAGNLAQFFTDDPKGRRIPNYLMTLAGDLAAERAAMCEELGHLRKNIDHVKDIVAMQQSYAKVSGVTEEVAVSELVDDALRMNASALARHGLNVIRDYQSTPNVTVDRHKVLQILVNVIRNAKYACDESGRADKEVTLRVTRDDLRVRIEVRDNGVGIPAENLTRIFAHGFTTRKEGHGFGLHSGALVAKQLGGALTAHSDGPGHGAVFTLELPLKPRASS